VSAGVAMADKSRALVLYAAGHVALLAPVLATSMRSPPAHPAVPKEVYPQESDLSSMSVHRSADGKSGCESDASPSKHAAAPRSKLQTGDLNQK
jgi:hypothetical protein